jgi:mono/diheme cytochrome c family protein
MNQRVKRLAVTGVGLALLTLTSVELIAGNASGQRRRASSSAAAIHVDDLFRANCARCHGADGRGDTPMGRQYQAPDFTDAEWWQKHSRITGVASLISIVSRGKGGMPAFERKLTRSEIKLLVHRVRRFRNAN